MFPELVCGEGGRVIDRQIRPLAVGGWIEENEGLRTVGVMLNNIGFLSFPVNPERGIDSHQT
jgi:hypothetical protein